MSLAVDGYKRRTASILLMALIVPLHAQQLPPWKDPSPHTTRFVPVEKGVRLEVLDWSGSGRPVVIKVVYDSQLAPRKREQWLEAEERRGMTVRYPNP
jgi:hypothetical protein